VIEISFAGDENVLTNNKMKNTVFQYLRMSTRKWCIK